MNRFREILSAISSPGVPAKKTRIISLFLGLPVAFLLFLYHGMSVIPSALLSLLIAAVIALTFVLEERTKKRAETLKEEIESDEYYHDPIWREKYLEYIRKHDFSSVKEHSMKADLYRNYFRISGVIMTVIACAFFIPALIWKSGEVSANVFLAIGGAIFLLWGIKKLHDTPVARFMREYSNCYEDIERSYMEGKCLAFREDGMFAEKSGINIGAGYTVMYDHGGISAIDNHRIIDVSRHTKATKCYGNGVYLGTHTDHYIIVRYLDGHDNEKSCSIRMNGFQIEMIYDELSVHHGDSVYSEVIKHDVG